MGSGESSCPLPRSAPVVRPLNSPFSSEPRVGACCLASMDSTARRGECHRHPPSPHSACIDANPTMKMEAILAKTVSGRIASVLILYQVDFWFLRRRIAQKPEVYLVLLHLEALSSPKNLGGSAQNLRHLILVCEQYQQSHRGDEHAAANIRRGEARVHCTGSFVRICLAYFGAHAPRWLGCVCRDAQRESRLST